MLPRFGTARRHSRSNHDNRRRVDGHGSLRAYHVHLDRGKLRGRWRQGAGIRGPVPVFPVCRWGRRKLQQPVRG